MINERTILVPPNLDAMAVEDLAALGKNAQLLSLYAQAKVAAMLAQKYGNSKKAGRYERRCEAIYSLLPTTMRWSKETP